MCIATFYLVASSPNMPIKTLTAYTSEGTYLCFLTVDEQVDFCIFLPNASRIGTKLPFNRLPWEVRQEFESQFDPHTFL